MFRLGVITDEASTGFERALDVIGSLGLRDVEIHTLWDTHIEALSHEQVANLRSLLAERGMSPVVLDSTVFLRCRLSGDDIPPSWSDRFQSIAGAYDQHLAWLERCLNTAHRLDSPLVRIFGFWRDGETTDAVVREIAARLREAVDMASGVGVRLALENCPHTYLDHTRRALRVLRAIDSPWLRLLWDPSNAYRSGESDVVDVADEALPYLAHMHVKGIVLDEALPSGRQYVVIEKGEVDYRRLLGRLLEAGYEGVVSLEPHYALPEDGMEGAARESFASLSRIIDSLKK